jgi:hypothetical protein
MSPSVCIMPHARSRGSPTRDELEGSTRTRVWAYVPGGAGRVVSDSQGEVSPNPPDGSACPEVMARIPRRGFPAGGPDRVRSCSIHVLPVSGFLRGASESELLSCLGLLPPVPSPPSSSSHSSVSVSIPSRRSYFGFGPGCGSVLSRASLRPPDQAFPELGLASFVSVLVSHSGGVGTAVLPGSRWCFPLDGTGTGRDPSSMGSGS